jgi:hypothetical protein
MRKVLFVCLLLNFIVPPSSSFAAVNCSTIQTQKNYFNDTSSRDYTSLGETIKYQRYILLVIKNKKCVSKRDYDYAKEYISDLNSNCPPRDGFLMDLYGKNTLSQMCAWAKKNAKLAIR